jgi:hypothetical protein
VTTSSQKWQLKERVVINKAIEPSQQQQPQQHVSEKTINLITPQQKSYDATFGKDFKFDSIIFSLF